MHQLPKEGYLRLSQIVSKLGKPKADPPIPPSPGVIPVCASSWWNGVKTGKYPKPLKLGPRTTVWRASDIRALLERTA